MPITITYRGRVREWSRACDQANDILASEALRSTIASRSTPFDESRPANLQPSTIAELFRDSTLSLTLSDYRRPSNVGGAYDPDTGQLWANVNAIHRTPCDLACVLLHEAVHALSHKTAAYDFTHARNGREGNENTAPYWIQEQVEDDVCDSKSRPLDGDHLLIEIRAVDRTEAADAAA